MDNGNTARLSSALGPARETRERTVLKVGKGKETEGESIDLLLKDSDGGEWEMAGRTARRVGRKPGEEKRALEQRKTNMLPTEPGRANPTPAEAAVAAAAAAAKRAAGGGAGAQAGAGARAMAAAGELEEAVETAGRARPGASATRPGVVTRSSSAAVAGEPASLPARQLARGEGLRDSAARPGVATTTTLSGGDGVGVGPGGNGVGARDMDRTRTVEYLKELTVVLEVEGDGQVAVMELMRAVKMLCGGLVGCRVTGPKTFEVTLSHVKGKERVLDGFKIDGVTLTARGLGNDELVVSFLNLPAYITDKEILGKIEGWGVSAASSIKRRMWPGTQITDGTRFLRVKFNEQVQSLPYSVRFDTAVGPVVCDYHGPVVSGKEGENIHKNTTGKETGYIFFFRNSKGQPMCIDAHSDRCHCHPDKRTFGRLVNHSKKKSNIKPLHCVVEGEITDVILFIATKDLPVGEEVLFDYGVNKKYFNNEGSDLDWL